MQEARRLRLQTSRPRPVPPAARPGIELLGSNGAGGHSDPAASLALSEALEKAQGRVLIGIINSVAVKGDPKAIPAVIGKLRDPDAAVAAAAAEALGKMGGDAAAAALTEALTDERANVRSSAAYGAVVCAEQFLANGDAQKAVSLYDKVRQANLPKQRILEATRGAILARKSDGIPLFIGTTPVVGHGAVRHRGEDGPGVARTRRHSSLGPGTRPSERRAAGAHPPGPRTGPMRRSLPKLLQVADNGSKPTRLTALSVLDRFQDLACVPVLLNGAVDNDPELARTGKAGLARNGRQRSRCRSSGPVPAGGRQDASGAHRIGRPAADCRGCSARASGHGRRRSGCAQSFPGNHWRSRERTASRERHSFALGDPERRRPRRHRTRPQRHLPPERGTCFTASFAVGCRTEALLNGKSGCAPCLRLAVPKRSASCRRQSRIRIPACRMKR